MPMMFASFLAGSLISLLIPIAVVIGLLVWHVHSLGRGPRGAAFPDAAGPGGAADVPGPPSSDPTDAG